MRKRFTILSLVLAAALLAGCSKGYDYKDGVMLTINGQDYTIDEVYASYGIKTNGYNGTVQPFSQQTASSYYNMLNDVVVEAIIKKDATMNRNVQADLKSFTDSVNDKASSNGVSYNTELEKELDDKGFDTLDQYEASLYLERKKTEATNSYKTDRMYTSKFIPNMIKDDAPYHVRHILVKFDSASDTSLYNGVISEQDAKDIYNTVYNLANGQRSFGQVAQTYSEDSGSAENFGDVGVMTTNTSFNSEFKFSVYTYDAYFNPALSAEQKKEVERETIYSTYDKKDASGNFGTEDSAVRALRNDYKEIAGEYAWGIPYSAAIAMSKYASVTKADSGADVDKAAETYYPRSVIYNNYFNNHGLSFIYLDDASESAFNGLKVNGNDVYTDSDYKTASASGRFQTVSGISDKLQVKAASSDISSGRNAAESAKISSHKILCDENGNPILVTRPQSGTGDSGYAGLHFIVIQYDPFTTLKDSIDTTDGKKIRATDYYTLTKPSTTKTDDSIGNTYVGYIASTDPDFYTSRVTSFKSTIDSCYPNIEYDRFKYYLDAAEHPTAQNKYADISNTDVNENGITVSFPEGSELESQILTYVDQQILTSTDATERSYRATWDTYTRMLKRANELQSRVLPVKETISAFQSNTLQNLINKRSGQN